MSYILVSNIGTLINKYQSIVRSELISDLPDTMGSYKGTITTDFDLGSWFEWSFNHILQEHYYLNVRNHHNSSIFENIFHIVEPSYVRLFNHCLDRNVDILKNLSPFLSAKAVLTHETIVIVVSPKIEL